MPQVLPAVVQYLAQDLVLAQFDLSLDRRRSIEDKSTPVFQKLSLDEFQNEADRLGHDVDAFAVLRKVFLDS